MNDTNHNDSLVIKKRQASWIIASLLFLFGLFFISGYMFGKRRAVQEFAHNVMNDSFIDQAHHSLYTMYGHNPVTEGTNTDTSVEEDGKGVTNEPSADAMSSMGTQEVEPAVVIEPEVVAPKVTKKYWAQLVGFRSEASAQEFVKRVSMLGVSAILKKRISKNNKGKTVVWYQVVTPEYDNEQELQRIVAIIKRAEKLKDVLIKSRKV